MLRFKHKSENQNEWAILPAYFVQLLGLDSRLDL